MSGEGRRATNAVDADSAKRSHPAGVGSALAVLGVVYGDIGTSPIYAFRECFDTRTGIATTPANVLGVLSLITWALLIVVSVKYLAYVMRADNRGEGGILALVSLLNPWSGPEESHRGVLAALGLFGAALLYGDGMITPAISVLSAVEGLGVAFPSLGRLVLPLAALVLTGLFAVQRHGTARVGAAFGPIMAVWFAVLGVLGARAIVAHPSVVAAVNPAYAVRFFSDNGVAAFVILGAVFLVVTGGEALYADMGHFGGSVIRQLWFIVVLPGLLLNYYGQGALILQHPQEVAQPFFHLAPVWARLPLVVLATAATVIASQAVISGAFSLTRQAVQLGQCPRMRILHTSSSSVGQIYVPAVNWVLMVASIVLVFAFGSSSALAAAYGVAVSTTMVVTTILAFFVARERWGWKVVAAASVSAAFLVVDLSFFGANMLKIAEGGWFPLAVAGVVFTLMTTWHRGRELLASRLAGESEPIHMFLDRIAQDPPVRVPGVAVFMSRPRASTPPVLLHQLDHLGVLHEKIVLASVETLEIPVVSPGDRVSVLRVSDDFFVVRIRYGFIESPNVPAALLACKDQGLDIEPDRVTYLLARETVLPTERPGMALWRDKLFAFMSRNASRATAYFCIPPHRVVELGLQVEI